MPLPRPLAHQIREDNVKGIYIAGVTEEYTTSGMELLEVMERGSKNRAVSATNMNAGSSRSHSVFTVTVSQKHLETGSAKQSKMVLVDLAGSEKVGKTGATGDRLEEAKNINKSLSALGQVINALTDPKIQHIPYRDSKLTRMLQESIGGNARTTLIIAISPSTYNAGESVSTCRFGVRAKQVKNKAVVNEEKSVAELSKLLKKAEFALDMQQSHIAAIEAQLAHYQSKFGVLEGLPPIELQATKAAAATEGKEGEDEAPAASSASAGGGADHQQPNSEGGAAAAAAVRAADGAAAAVVTQLQQRVQSLAEELEDEKDENQRKSKEVATLTNLLQQKDELIEETTLQLQAEEERADAAVADLQDSNEQAQAAAEEEAELHKQQESYQIQELQCDIESLQDQNDKYMKDNEELAAALAAAQAGGDSEDSGGGAAKVVGASMDEPSDPLDIEAWRALRAKWVTEQQELTAELQKEKEKATTLQSQGKKQ